MNLRVLLLEDSPADLDLTKMALQRTPGPSLEIVGVDSLKSAVRELESKPFDVVLSDLNLPDSQGMETVKRLVGPNRPPVVAHTGSVDESQGLQALQAGADDFVVKGSVGGVRLREVLQFAVQRRRTLGGLPQQPEQRLEQLILERTKALSDSRAQLLLATNGLSEVIFLADIEPFRIVFVNEAYRRLFGQDPAEVMKDPFGWATKVHPDDRERLLGLIQGDPKAMPRFFRFRIGKPSGAIRWAQVHVETANDLEGRPKFWSGCIQDITEVVEAEEVQRKAAEQEERLKMAKDAERFKSDFLNMAAHELGTPLTPIRLQLASMRILASQNPDERLNASMAVMDRNVARLCGLIQDLLQVGRLQARTLKYKWAEADLAALCAEAVAGMQPLAQQSGVELRLQGPNQLLARIDRERFSQIVLNLLSNALKYTPKPGKAVMRVRREGEDAIVEVEDTGRGISPGDLPLLFSPFTRVGDTQTVKGTGLGLYICKGFVEAHGGSISAKSEGLGKGTLFTLRVPIKGPPETSDGAGDLGPPQSATQNGGTQPKRQPDEAGDARKMTPVLTAPART